MNYNLLNLLDRPFNDSFFNFFTNDYLGNTFTEAQNSRMGTRIKDGKEKYTVLVSLPGVKKEDLRIDYRDNYLNIQGKKKVERKENAKYYLSERFEGDIKQSVLIPYEIDTSQISAQVKNGVLEVTLPKSTKHLSKEIEING